MLHKLLYVRLLFVYFIVNIHMRMRIHTYIHTYIHNFTLYIILHYILLYKYVILITIEYFSENEVFYLLSIILFYKFLCDSSFGE